MTITISEQSMAEAFPDADPGVQPFGSRVLVQIRNPKQKTASGIILDSGSVETEKWNTQAAKIISVGPLAFKNRNTMEAWPEGNWCQPGDFVRVAKYGGDRWEIPVDKDRTALYVIFNDLDIIGRVTGNPLAMKAFI